MRRGRSVFSSSFPVHIPPWLMERNSEKSQAHRGISTRTMVGKVPGDQYHKGNIANSFCPTEQKGKEGRYTLNGYVEPHRLPHNMFATVRIKMIASWLMRYLSIGLHGPRSP